MEKAETGTLVRHAALSGVFLAAFGLLFVLLVPRRTVQTFSRHTSRLVKWSLVLNYLTLLLLLQLTIGLWWARALVLGALVGTTWIGMWVLCRVLWPVTAELRDIYTENTEHAFNPSQTQGRSGRFH